VVTTDTGIETTVMNICFSTRSVRIYVKNAPPEWLPCKRIVTHTTRKGDSADEGTIIEDLHNKLLAAEDKIVNLEKDRQRLADKISRNYLGELLRAVNVMQQGLQEKKHKIQQVESGLAAITAVMDKMKSEEVKE